MLQNLFQFFLLFLFCIFLPFRQDIYEMQELCQFSFLKIFINKTATIFFLVNGIILFLAKDSAFLANSINKRKAAQCPAQDFSGNKQAVETSEVEETTAPMESDGNLEKGKEELQNLEELGMDDFNKRCADYIEREKKRMKIEALHAGC